ncbi:UDP-GlcNAc:betaGal beta-1,3-N-acetylglucosaminyltransferase 7, like [Thunnus albacares]|uniref:UDP-GlcNAc:betaGal beta-1,3-N-acetylglucosaminyltransferase 7, like n=1 Tax=Thunnus maccoyii TaxID=8240 RepID=UPI001C4B89A8|nr:UDP-GlcNAc:betaGal beta-1,3-N-acetylglucosaminyltransferase 7, like [Thunnus maccoyii]XP_044207131.1 UDP-GlcNAc:betaGal beta-1,3-N-acetylglucosaminyltransferase 7, like [Thunnus albacares]|eukprot:superscaffoldBa00001559_g11084
MDHFSRRKRVGLLKPLLSLSLVFASFLMIHKLKVAEKDGVGVKHMRDADWCGSDCFSLKKGAVKTSLGSSNSPALSSDLDAQRVSNGTPASWDAQVLNCSEDATVRTKDWFRRLDPRFHQFVLHRHCRYFPMLINHPEKCTDGEVHLLMVVKSVIEQHDRREAVRKTWGKEHTVDGKKIRTLFLLGSPTTGKDTKNLQKLIEYEDQIYGDILQWDFMDTFFNLTLKEVNFLKWFDVYCSGVQFIFKGDDDVFVNTHNLLDLIGFKVEDRKEADLFVGDTISKAIPIRNRQSKYYIPKELYDKPYPPYAGGGGFLMSSQLARRLFVVSEGLELYPIDDVFLGMCLQKLHLTPEMHPGFRTFGITRRRVSPMNSEPCFYKNLIVVHKLSAQELLRMWSVVHNEDLVCAQRTSI